MPTAQISREIFVTRMPRMLELEVFELKNEHPDFVGSAKYKNFLREYSAWSDAELISRLRILCTNSRQNFLEICAVYDEFQTR